MHLLRYVLSTTKSDSLQGVIVFVYFEVVVYPFRPPYTLPVPRFGSPISLFMVQDRSRYQNHQQNDAHGVLRFYRSSEPQVKYIRRFHNFVTAGPWKPHYAEMKSGGQTIWV